MAMENSSVLSNDASKEISSASKEDLTTLGSSTAAHVGDDTTQKSNTEDSLLDDKPKDVLDPEGDFVDAEAVPEDVDVDVGAPDAAGVNSLDSRRSSEGADGEDVVDDENGSVESFDSALERIAAASTGSPEAPSSPLFQPTETIQQVALKRLNLLNSGVSSLETTLLENVSPAEFKTRVVQIGQSLGLSADNEDVQYILSVLLPLVKGEKSEAAEDVADVGGDGADDSNIADGADASKQENSSQMASNGDIEVHPVKEFQSEDVGDEANAIKNSTTTRDNEGGSSERNLPEDMLKSSATNLVSEESAAEEQAIEIGNYEQEPEVIEWEDLNESDVDDVANSNVQPLPAEIKGSKEIAGSEGVDAAGLQQEPGTTDEDHESKTSAIEGVEKGVAKLEPEVDSSMENTVVDSAEQHRDDSEEEAREPVEHADTPVESKEVTEDTAYGSSEVVEVPERLIASGDLIEDKEGPSGEEKDRGDTDSKAIVAEEQPFAEGMAERKDGEAQSRELELDEGKAETSKAVLPDGLESKADSSLVSDEGTIENVTLGDTDVIEGSGVGKVAPVAEIQDVNVNETVEGGLPSEKDESFKGEGSKQESPNIDKTADETVEGESPLEKDESFKREESKESLNIDQTADVLVEGEESVTEHASSKASVGDSNEEKSKDRSLITQKATDASAEGEVSVLEIPPPVAAVAGSKASTAPGNDTASSLGGAGPSLPVRPAGLGRSVPSLEHAPRAAQRSSGVPAATRQSAVTNEENQSSTDVTEGSEDAREKLQMIRVKFLRLAHRLGQSAHNVVVAQVLYRLGLAEQLRGGRGSGRTGAFAFERASVLAEEQEAAGADDLEFGCTIMVLGKSGVGKSATINSLFDEVKSGTNAYSPATNKVQEIIGTVHGIKLRVIDTPGLLTSFADQRRNERIMASVKRFIKKSPPDIVLYFDRLDMQSRDYGDLPLLRTITDTFGSAVWFNAIVVLTHASSAPPDGANGVPVSYEMFVAQRSHVVQQTIRQAAGDMRLMNPVSLVENHAACRRNRAGERVLPNGQVWKPQLLLLCFASKILAEANSLLKLQDSSPAKPFGVRSRVPPLPFLLSSLLQSRAQLKLPDEQIGSDDESEDESEDEADSEGEEEYDDLPPFRRLTKDELKLLDKEQRRIYAEELEYREKLFMKKQLKDERARKKEMKRRLAALPKDMAQYSEESLEEENASASVPVPMPDMALPPSFDSDNPTHRYRYLDTANQWLVRPVLETHGWDHDSGYDGLNVEKMFVVSKKIPVSVSGQVTKDKKEANLQMECAASFKNGEGKVTQTGLDIQTIGKDLAYTLRSETRFDNFKRNKTTCGLAVTLLGDTVAAGMKIEDRLLIGKRVKLVFNGGALTGRGDVAYGGSLEATIRDKDYPIGQFLSTFGLSVMDWHGDLAIGGNLQVQCKVGKTMTIVRGNLNNRRAGQVSIRVSSSEQLQMALIGLIPLLRTFINNRILSSN